MRFAEQQAGTKNVGVVLQDHADIRTQLRVHKRGEGVRFFPCFAISVSGSSILRRAVDAVFFMLWVFAVLLIQRPKKVYVSTDPPVLVPFVVMGYCALFRAKYVYHLQDIHPELSRVVMPVHPVLYHFLRWLDSVTMRRAHLLITLTEAMESEIRSRSRTRAPIVVLSNPSVSFDEVISHGKKIRGFAFCGNAGRLQRIPLLIEAIDRYCRAGGNLPFVFAGAGIYSSALQELAEKHSNIDYRGLVSASEAAQVNVDYAWALLPIEDEITQYAFPSKTSSYVFSGALIAAVCSSHTSVAQWVKENRLGVVIEPSVDALCRFFNDVSRGVYAEAHFDMERGSLKEGLRFDVFVEQLTKLVVDDEVDAGGQD